MALDAVASDSPTMIPDRRAAGVQHGGEVPPTGGCDASSRKFRSACRGSERRDTSGAGGRSGLTHGVSAAHLKAIQHGAGRLFEEADKSIAVSTLTVHRIRGSENTRQASCNTMKVNGPGRGDANGSSGLGQITNAPLGYGKIPCPMLRPLRGLVL